VKLCIHSDAIAFVRRLYSPRVQSRLVPVTRRALFARSRSCAHQVEKFLSVANQLRRLSVLGAAAGADAADEFGPSNLQVWFNVCGIELHLILSCCLTQDLLNILNESANVIGLHIRRFKCTCARSKALALPLHRTFLPQAPLTAPSTSAFTPQSAKAGDCSAYMRMDANADSFVQLKLVFAAVRQGAAAAQQLLQPRVACLIACAFEHMHVA
jgi:hypothetical protein